MSHRSQGRRSHPLPTEAELQSVIADLAKWLGYRLQYHTYDSRRSAMGFPDLVLVGRGRVLFVEVKSDTGQLTKQQIEWYAGLLDNGAEAYIWRPEDWKNGTVEKELKRGNER